MPSTDTDLQTACRLAFRIAKKKFTADNGRKIFDPIELGGQKLIPIVFTQIGSHHIDICFFLGGQKYSRKSLMIDRDGRLYEDKVGVIPDFDLTQNEPDFSATTNEDIVQLILPKIYEA